MPILRQDIITGEWVIFAPERRSRPLVTHERQQIDYRTHLNGFEYDPSCDFCPGNEHTTPSEVDAFREPDTLPDSPGWRVRAFPNKYPALDSPEYCNSDEQTPPVTFTQIPGQGGHEVIVEIPRHNATLGWGMTLSEAGEAGYMYWRRYSHWAAQPDISHITIFKNHGAAAGASQPHAHTQFLAMPVVPERILNIAHKIERYKESTGKCSLCHLIKEEQSKEERIISEENGFTVFCPPAGQYAYETWIVPKAHQSGFGQLLPEDADHLGRTIHRALSRINKALDQPAHNLVLIDSPLQNGAPVEPFHWHIRIIPKTAQTGGLEIGTSAFINLVLPEEAARVLKRFAP